MLQKKTLLLIGIPAFLLWLIVGFAPMLLYGFGNDRAGVVGDSFAVASSLFSSFAFLIATYALIMQIQESHEAGKIQKIQIDIQTKQATIAEDTAKLQQTIREDGRRQVAMTAFLKINNDTMQYRHALLAWHPSNNRPTHSQVIDQETDRRLKKDYFDAYTALRSNCLSVGLIFGDKGNQLGKAIQQLYASGHRLTTIPAETVPPAHYCEQQLDTEIQTIEQEMKPLWNSLFP